MMSKVSENATDDLEYWLSPEIAATQPTSTSVAALPDTSDTTEQQPGPEFVDSSKGPTSVG